MTLSETALVLTGLLLAVWTLGAGWLMLAARAAVRRAEAGRKAARRLARMIEEAPAIPMLVRADGRIEAPQRLAAWLGLDAVPGYLSELDGGDSGLESAQLAELTDAIRLTQKAATPFRMALTPRGSRRSLAMRGHLADPQVSPGGAALVWVFDFSESESELSELRSEAARARDDFAALV
ncbi:MAG: histidine kinase, partial [Novosphingobium sp.]|nr:histidine kinase [Novosphingobium sp.]